MNPPDSFRHLTVSSGIRSAATRHPGKTALVCGTQRRSYAELVEAMDRIAHGVRGLGLQFGQHAALVAPNCLEYIEIVAGVADMGGAVATPNPRLTPRELADICNDAQARILFVHPSALSSIDRSLMDSVEHLIVLGPAYEAFKARASAQGALPCVPEWATFSIPYTSGTTGKPKGVMLPHRSRSLIFLAYAAEYGIYSPDDHYLAFAPMCHGAGLAYAMATIFVGGTTEIMAKFDPEQVLQAVHSGRVTGMFTVPTHYHAIFSLSNTFLDAHRGNRLKGIVANAAPMSQDTKVQVIDYFGEGLLNETYGSTEAAVVTNLRPQDQLRKRNCVGLPLVGNQIKLLGEQGQELGPGEVGELYSISPYLFNGYWQRPEATAEAFRDGWVSVGDLAMRDDEGYLYIVDRKKDMVISGGMNVYPREVEDQLNQHPLVKDSAVIGVPDPQWGERLVACLVLHKGQNLDEADLLQFGQRTLAPYKQPKQYLRIDELPRNANGKVLKTSLRQWYAARAIQPA